MDKYILMSRDGVINVRQDDPITQVEQLVLLPYVQESCLHLEQLGWKAIILVNEPALANGVMDQSVLKDIHARMYELISEGGGRVTDVMVCPSAYAPWDKCAFPKAGLLQLAAYKHALDLPTVYFVGDCLECLQAAWTVGCKSGLVRSGNPYKTLQYLRTSDRVPDLLTNDLLSMVYRITGSPPSP